MAANVTFMDWTAELVVDGSTVQKPISEITEVPTGTPFSLSGTVSVSGYLYAVEVSESDIAVIYPANEGLDQEAAGAQLQLPSDGSQFSAPIDGELRVFSSPTPMTEADWAALFPGRDPPMQTGNGRGSIGKPPAKPKQTTATK